MDCVVVLLCPLMERSAAKTIQYSDIFWKGLAGEGGKAAAGGLPNKVTGGAIQGGNRYYISTRARRTLHCVRISCSCHCQAVRADSTKEVILPLLPRSFSSNIITSSDAVAVAVATMMMMMSLDRTLQETLLRTP